MRVRLWLVVFLLIGMNAFSGCAKLRSPKLAPARELKLPEGKMSPDSVSLELAVAELEPDQFAELENLWAELDHQKIDLTTRRTFDLNGLRCAVIPVRTPAALFRLVEPREIVRDSLEPWQQEMYDKGILKPETRLLVHKQIQNREGGHHTLQTSDVYPETSWIVREESSQSAGAGKNVRGVYRITTYPQGDGSVRIVVLPQIHHGLPRQRIGVRQSTFLFETAQSIASLDALKIDTTLSNGESLIIGSTSELDDLGAFYFQAPPRKRSGSISVRTMPPAAELLDSRLGAELETDMGSMLDADPGTDKNVNTSGRSQRILLIRLVQTQKNDLFDRRSRKERLVSTIPD